MNTSAPQRASSRAMPRPTPREPPVTRARRPEKSNAPPGVCDWVDMSLRRFGGFVLHWNHVVCLVEARGHVRTAILFFGSVRSRLPSPVNPAPLVAIVAHPALPCRHDL